MQTVHVLLQACKQHNKHIRAVCSTQELALAARVDPPPAGYWVEEWTVDDPRPTEPGA